MARVLSHRIADAAINLGSLLALLAPAHSHCRAAAFADLARIALHACSKLARVGQRLGAQALSVTLASSPLGRAPLRTGRFWNGHQSKTKREGCGCYDAIHSILSLDWHF
jgi:hypothetical protein